jgi:cytochrome c peroxidase
MSRSSNVVRSAIVLACLSCDAVPDGGTEVSSAALEAAPNPFGVAETFHTSGAIDRTNPFFQALGTNPRTCETCHSPAQGWTITAAASAALFDASDGLAPLFNLVDEGWRPDADISTLDARRETFGATLLERGLTRFNRTVPATSEFTVTDVNDPSGFATPTRLIAFRRSTPTANEAKVASTNWNAGPHDVPTQLFNTVGGAARLHGQRVDPLPPELAAASRDFQLGVFFAQIEDRVAGRLDAAGAMGGPAHLAAQPFYVGINDLLGGDPTGRPFSRKVFDLFDAWSVFDTGNSGSGSASDADRARAAIYRGQEIFNFREFAVRGVHGLNDVLGQERVEATCSTCHNVPNVGGHAVFRMFNTGTAEGDVCGADLPRLTLQHKVTGEIKRVCDMGRGGNGTWADVGAFRAPPLRGLPARAPYFHDGQARDVRAVIDFYERRFGLGLNGTERDDLIAFLGAL